MESTASYSKLLKDLMNRIMSIPLPRSEIGDRLGWGPAFDLFIKASDFHLALHPKPQLIQNIT